MILQYILNTYHPKHHVRLNINLKTLFTFLFFGLWNEVVFAVKAKNKKTNQPHRQTHAYWTNGEKQKNKKKTKRYNEREQERERESERRKTICSVFLVDLCSLDFSILCDGCFYYFSFFFVLLFPHLCFLRLFYFSTYLNQTVCGSGGMFQYVNLIVNLRIAQIRKSVSNETKKKSSHFRYRLSKGKNVYDFQWVFH